MENLKNVDVVLLTRGRVNEQILLNSLSLEILKLITIVCHPGEKTIHEKNWGGKVKNILEYTGNYVGEARQWCIDNLTGGYIIFFEDNVNLHIRAEKPDFGNVRAFGLYEISNNIWNDSHFLQHQINLLNDIVDKLKTGDYGIIGISQRSGNNRIEEDFVENCRIYGVWGLNKKLYNTLNCKISDVVYREDFYIILKFLLSGIKVGMFSKYAFNKKNGVNSTGGCSLYRNPIETNKNVEWLVEEFKGFVKAKENEKISWKGYNGVALDVIIQWKKAYEFGLNNRRLNNE